MHEVGIVQSILDVAGQQASIAGATRIHVIRLRVGQMTGVVPEALQHAFVVLRAGTLAENAELSVENVPAVAWCVVCQQEFETPGPFCECPVCETPSRDVRHGRELEIVSLEVE